MRITPLLRLAALATTLVALAVPALASAAQKLYVVDDAVAGQVRGFAIAANGSLTPVPGLPGTVGPFPLGVAITPDAKHLYVGSGGVRGFDIAADGSLTTMTGSPFGPASAFDQIAISPDGTHAFAAGHFANNVAVFDVAANGALTQIPGSPFPADNTPFGIALTPDAKHLYATNANSANISAYNVAANGSLTAVTGSPFLTGGTDPFFAGVTPDGAHLYTANNGSSNVSGFTIAANGSLSQVPGSPFTTGSDPFDVTVSPDGTHLYTGNQGGSNISAFNVAASGALSQLPTSPFTAGTGTRGVDLTQDGRFLYAGNLSTDNVSAFNVAATGGLTAVAGSPFPAGDGPTGVAITPDQGPVAAFSPATSSSRSVAFDGSSSTDSDGTVARYDWDFGDGSTLANGVPAPTHDYAADGTYTVKLTVTDDEGCSTAPVYNGQTLSCNGGPKAALSQPLTVDTQLEGAKLKAKKTQKQKGSKIAIKAKAGAAEDVTLAASGTVKVGPKSYRLKKLSKSVAAGQTKKLKLKLKKSKDATKVLAALGGKVKASLKVKFTDALGNVATKTKKVKLK